MSGKALPQYPFLGEIGQKEIAVSSISFSAQISMI